MVNRFSKKDNQRTNTSLTNNILKHTSKNGLRATKAIGGFLTQTALAFTKGTAKKISRWSLRKLKLFILTNLGLVLPIVIVLAVIFVSLGSLASTILVVYAHNKVDNAIDATQDMVSTYTQYLLEQRQQGNIDYGDGNDSLFDDSEVTNPLTGGGTGSVYEDTLDNAHKLEGTSLVTQAYNALLESQNKTSLSGYNMQLIYGISITESCCSPIKWMFYMPVGTDYNSNGDYDINSYGVNEFMRARLEGKIDATAFTNMYNDGSSYIGPYQMDAALFKDGAKLNSIRPSGYSPEAWVNLVQTLQSSKVSNSTGIADPFNLKDTLEVLSHYMVNSRANMISKMQLSTLANEEDMRMMALAVRHVGTTNKTKTRSDGCAFNGYDTQVEWRGEGNMWCYPFIEDLNPHLNLWRSAVNEYQSNGEIFQEYKAYLDRQSRTNANGGELGIIEKLYIKEGWTKTSSGWSKSFGDGDGYVTISGQDVAYPFRVYWGAKVGFPNFEAIAKGQ